MSYRKHRLALTTYVTIGATIIASAILHSTYTNIFPIITQYAIFLLFIPAFFIGIICIEFKDALAAMFLSMFVSIVIISSVRSLPAIIGIVTQDTILFIISQFALSLPLFFPLVLIFVLGTVSGLLFNEFVIEPRIKDII